MSFTQNVFHPGGMPNGGQYIYVYGSKGAVDLMGSATMYPPGNGGQPAVLSPKVQEDQYAHIAAFYDAIATGTPPAVDVKVGAAAALTAILGHQAMVQEKVVNWSDLGVEV
jgi:predicted dehydrogenase